MRVVVHYLVSVVVLSFYGGQVCPLVESLDIRVWFLQLAGAFGLAFLLRFWLIRRLVLNREYQVQVKRQFWTELSLFLGVGLVLALLNNQLYNFPTIGSGLKILLGCLTLGFFEAADLALERERLIHRELTLTGRELLVASGYVPMARKFVMTASVTAFAAAAVMILLILKDLGWMTGREARVDPEFAQRAVLIEIVFAGVVFLAEILNTIKSFAQNLELFVSKENEVLQQAARGDLSRFVVVGANDEFGVMAQYTNVMINNLRAKTEELQLTRDATIVSLASLAETRDNETGAHILRTQRYVLALADQLHQKPGYRERLDDETRDLLYKSAPLHDVGKVGVPDAVLLKPGRLTPEEFEIIKTHTIHGRDALQAALDRLGQNSFLKLAQEIAYSHHEKWDGSGYPQGLSGEDIPLSGRLMALADVYDALISKRVYKPAFSHEKAKGIILEGRGSHFDPAVTDAFLEIEDKFVRIAAEFSDAPTQEAS